MEENKWFAVMTDRQDTDWGYGSDDREIAERMVIGLLEDNPEAYIAVIEGDVCIDEIKPVDFGFTKRYTVTFGSGESRGIMRDGKIQPADWMLSNVEGIELYAEMENPTWNDEKEWFDDEFATFDDLKMEIIRQAIAKHLEPDWLDFGD